MPFTDNRVLDRPVQRHPAALPRTAKPAVTAERRKAPGDFRRSSHLWTSIPRELVVQFLPHADALASAIVQEISSAVPEYAQTLAGPAADSIARGVKRTIHATSNPAGGHHDWAATFRELGRKEYAAGRSLDCLQSAYRIGGRVVWRHLAAFGQRRGVSTDVACACAEAIFAYVDEISTLSMAGYASAKAEVEGTRVRCRRRLMDQLLSGAPVSPVTLTELANSAGWRLPERLVAVVVEPRKEDHRLDALAARPELLADLDNAQPHLLVPEDQLAAVEATLEQAKVRAAIGPRVRIGEASVSLNRARQTIALVRRGLIPDAPISRWADNLTTLWLLADQFLVAQISSRSLAPLDGLTEKRRARMCDTLLAWLQTRGSAPDLAAQLQVHPQTARYRMRQLEELFGERLRAADERLNLEIALRAEQLHNRARERNVDQ